MKSKFDDAFNKIILECKENKVISEGFFRKMSGALKSKKGKNKMIKDSIISWMNGNKLEENGAPNKFIGTLPNGYTIKFTFRESEWNDPESTQISYAVYLRDTEGRSITLDKQGVIDYGYSESDIKNELKGKLSVALNKKELKSSLTTKKEVDNAKLKEDRKAEKEKAAQEKAAAKAEKKAAKEQAAQEKAAAKAAAEEEAKAQRLAQAEKDAEELSED
jgi:hypothetical protein